MRRNFKEGFNGTHGGDSYNGANANERSFSYRTGKAMRNLVDGYNGVEGSKGLFSLAGKSTRGLVNLPRNFKGGYQGIPEVTGWSAGLGKGVRNIVDFGVGMKNNFMEGTSGGGKGVSGWAGRQVGRTGNFIKNASAQKVMGTAMLSQGVLGLFNSARQLNNIEDNEFQRDAMMREALIQGGQSAGSVLFGSNMLFSKNGSKMGAAGKAGMLLMAGSSLPGLFATKNVVDPQTGRSKKTWDGYAASYHAENLANLGLMLHPGLMKGTVNPKMFGWGMALQAGGTGINMLANNMSEGSAKNRVTATGDLLSSSGGIVGDIGMTMATGGINKIIEGAFDGVERAAALFNKHDIKFIINSSFTKRNQPYIMETFRKAKSLGAHAWYMFLIVPTGRGEEIFKELVSKEDYEEILEWHYKMEREEEEILVRPTCAPQYYRIWHDKSKEEGKIAYTHNLEVSYLRS